MIVLNRDQMYNCDRMTIEEAGIPGKELMENAGSGCAAFIKELLQEAKARVLVFCGSGNNGGDGFVIARYLKEWGCSVCLVLVGKEEKMSAETHSNYLRCAVLNIPVKKCSSSDDWQQANLKIESYDLVIDAIFGVGFTGTLKGWLSYLFKEINQKSRTTIAIDIASGTDADTGQADIAIKAEYTLTMAAAKYGSLIGKGKYCAGKVKVIDIGIPRHIFAKVEDKGTLLTKQSVCFPERRSYYHKGNYGRVAVIAGSPGFSGAAVMSCRAALRSGAGLITLFHPQGMENTFETLLIEVMTQVIPPQIDDLLTKLEAFDLVLIGPGIGKTENMKNILKILLNKWKKPLIIDADALNLLAENRLLLKNLTENVLLTPHLGEFARLAGCTIAQLQSSPVNKVKEFCRNYGTSVLLKSSATVFTDGKAVILDISGNDGLATGGSGDVLAGIIAGFTAQGLQLNEAAVSASWLMGKTAEKLAEKRGTPSIIPTDIIENLFVF